MKKFLIASCVLTCATLSAFYANAAPAKEKADSETNLSPQRGSWFLETDITGAFLKEEIRPLNKRHRLISKVELDVKGSGTNTVRLRYSASVSLERRGWGGTWKALKNYDASVSSVAVFVANEKGAVAIADSSTKRFIFEISRGGIFDSTAVTMGSAMPTYFYPRGEGVFNARISVAGLYEDSMFKELFADGITLDPADALVTLINFKLQKQK